MAPNDRIGQPAICTPRYLPPDLVARADEIACRINPANKPKSDVRIDDPTDTGRLALLRRVYWGKQGVRLTVGFLDDPPADLRARILSHMNAWNETANVEFAESMTDPQVRIARLDSPSNLAGGYWSYLGTDILSIPSSQPTMNLEGFTMATRDPEFFRVVRHETGHTLGFPHEHMRAALVAKLDREKVIKEFMRTQGWSRDQVIEQVLRPIEESSLLGSPGADGNSIMCYQISGDLTIDGRSIPGGIDIDPIDRKMAAVFYPKANT